MKTGNKENLIVYKQFCPKPKKKTCFPLCLPQCKKQSHNWQSICYHEQLRNPNHLHSCSPANSYWCTLEKTLCIVSSPSYLWSTGKADNRTWSTLSKRAIARVIFAVNTVFQPTQTLAKAFTCTQKTGLNPDPGKSQGKYTKQQKREKLKFETILSTDTQSTFPLQCHEWTAPLNSFHYNCSCRQDAGEKGERIRGQRDIYFL